MLSLGTVDENLHFLFLEVIRQVERTRTFLLNPSEKLLQAILTRDDYIDHLRTIIQRRCFALAREAYLHDRFEIELLKSLDLITGNLERIADFCESIGGQFAYLRSQSFIGELRVADNLDALVEGLEKVESALDERDVHAALENLPRSRPAPAPPGPAPRSAAHDSPSRSVARRSGPACSRSAARCP